METLSSRCPAGRRRTAARRAAIYSARPAREQQPARRRRRGEASATRREGCTVRPLRLSWIDSERAGYVATVSARSNQFRGQIGRAAVRRRTAIPCADGPSRTGAIRYAQADAGSRSCAHHLQVHRAARGAQRERLGFAPAVRRRERVDFPQQPAGARLQLCPEEASNVNGIVPLVLARRAAERQLASPP